MSKLEVDAIEPQSGTTLTLGASGDSVNIASGATITDFTSTGIDDNATSTAITIDSSEQVGIGTAPSYPFHVSGIARFDNYINFGGSISTPATAASIYRPADNTLAFGTASAERMRIGSDGRVGINTTSPSNRALHIGPDSPGVTGSSNEQGWSVSFAAAITNQTTNANLDLNDSSSSSGTHNYIIMRYQGSAIGDIDTTNNSTIRYNTFTGGHWSQFHDGTNPELKKGTVMSLTGDKLEYSECEKTFTYENGETELQKFEIAGTHEIGSEVTVPNDQHGEENSTTTATVVSNSIADHLVKVKVSDSVADKAVYGVWSGKYNDGDLSVEALGTSTIRIKQGEVLEVGDLLESAGDGTAQKQSDGIIKNSTIAKVTSTTVIETYDDNSFLVSCVLYCG